MDKTFSSNEVKTLVLVGRTGNGKSATGNSILGRRTFKSKTSSSGVTRVCELQRTKDKPIINVIDTPEEEQATFLALQALFGHKIVDYMIVVFTGGDELEENEETLEGYIGFECPQPLKDILILCGNRKVLFDNKTKDKEKQSQQVEELLNLVNMVISHNGGQPFTNELFMQLKEKAKLRDDQQKTVDSLKGYSKAEMMEIKMQMQQNYEDELKRMTNMVELKMKEETANLWKILEEERLARKKAEENYKLIQIQSKEEIERLREKLGNQPRGLPFPFNILLPFPFGDVRPKPPCAIL